jgi:hypothetical protein
MAPLRFNCSTAQLSGSNFFAKRSYSTLTVAMLFSLLLNPFMCLCTNLTPVRYACIQKVLPLKNFDSPKNMHGSPDLKPDPLVAQHLIT